MIVKSAMHNEYDEALQELVDLAQAILQITKQLV